MYDFKKSLLLIILSITLILIVNSHYMNLNIFADEDNDIDSLKNMTVYSDYKTYYLSGTNYTDIKVDKKNLNLSSFSVSIWFNSIMDVNKRTYGFLINKGGANSERPGYNMNYGIWLTPQEKIQGGFETKDGDDYYITTKKKYNDGKWYNVLITYDTKVIRLYIDGKEVGNNSTVAYDVKPDTKGDQPIRIGANSLILNKKINGNFTGQIGNIMLWDRALNSQQVSTIYNSQLQLHKNNQTDIKNDESNSSNVFEKIGSVFGGLFN